MTTGIWGVGRRFKLPLRPNFGSTTGHKLRFATNSVVCGDKAARYAKSYGLRSERQGRQQGLAGGLTTNSVGREDRGALPLEHPSRKLIFLHLRLIIDKNYSQIQKSHRHICRPWWQSARGESSFALSPRHENPSATGQLMNGSACKTPARNPTSRR